MIKTLRNIVISSDGSFYFSSTIELALTNKLIIFRKHDDKNFVLNQKKDRKVIESRRSSFYKKKYLK